MVAFKHFSKKAKQGTKMKQPLLLQQTRVVSVIAHPPGVFAPHAAQ
jgi:hypothetical protein